MNDSALFGNTISPVKYKKQKSLFDKFGFGASWVYSIVIQCHSVNISTLFGKNNNGNS